MINALDFGADPAGATDSTAALQAAINAAPKAGRLYLPHGRYSISGLTGLSNMEIVGDGDATVLSITSNAVALNFAGCSNWRVRDLAIQGTGLTYTGYGCAMSDSGQVGIKANGATKATVRDVTIRNIAGDGLQYQNAPSWTPEIIFDGLAVSSCYRGINITLSGEYASFNDLNVFNCVFGLIDDSGNNSFVGCKFVFNSIGVKLTGGTNNGHGIFSACEMNHSAYNLTAVDVLNGMSFVGCHLVADQSGSNSGLIQIIDCRGINFAGGQLGSNISVDGGSLAANGENMVLGMYARTDITGFAAPVLTNGGLLLVKNCFTASGLWSANN